MTGTVTATLPARPDRAARGGHLLIVDDNTMNRMLLTRALQDHGHTVATADNGEEGLAVLRAQRGLHDVVLLDIMMPVMDGFETLSRIKSDEALRDLPVVMISSVDETGAVTRCLQMGASDYILKPFNATRLHALSNRITALLTAKWAQRREREQALLLEDLAEAVSQLASGRPISRRLREIAARRDAPGRLARAVERLAGSARAMELDNA